MSTTYSPAPVFIPTTTTTTTTTVIPPVEVVPTTVSSREVVNDPDVTHHKQTTVKLVTELSASGTKDSSNFVTTITNRITNEDEVTTKKAALDVVAVKPVSENELKGDPREKGEVIPVKVDDGIASGVIEVATSTETSLSVEDNYPTTKIWVPDTSLSAEHKGSNDQNVAPEAVTLPPQSQTTISTEPLRKEIHENITSEDGLKILSSTLSPSSSSTTSEPIEEVSLTTTTSDNMSIM